MAVLARAVGEILSSGGSAAGSEAIRRGGGEGAAAEDEHDEHDDDDDEEDEDRAHVDPGNAAGDDPWAADSDDEEAAERELNEMLDAHDGVGALGGGGTHTRSIVRERRRGLVDVGSIAGGSELSYRPSRFIPMHELYSKDGVAQVNRILLRMYRSKEPVPGFGPVRRWYSIYGKFMQRMFEGQ
jgi:hypothetical protein